MPLVRAKIVWAALGALALTVTAVYFSHYPLAGFTRRLYAFLLAGGFLLLCAAAGRRLLRGVLRGAGPAPGGAEEFVWSVGCGAPLFALGHLLFGLAGIFRPPFFWAAAAGVALLARRELWDWTLRLGSWARRFGQTRLEGANLLIGLLAGFSLLVALLCALAPPTYYDSLVYHLALPAGYLREGSVGFVPFNHYSHFPQYMEMIYAWFLAWGSDVGAQLFTVLLAVLTGVLLVQLGRETLGQKGPRWELLLFATAPCTLLLGTETYVEVPLAFWTTLALAAALRYRAGGSERWLLLAGIFGGFCAGIKYTGALTPALLGVLMLLGGGRRSWGARWRAFAWVGGPSFLLFLPWLIKNAWLTGGNPVFPFLPRFFPAENVHMPVASADGYFRVLAEYGGSSALLRQIFEVPLRLVTDVVSLGGGFDVTGDLGWALLLVLFPFSFLALKGPGDRRFLLAYVVLHGLIWLSLRPVLRFLYPVFPAVCLLAGLGLAQADKSVPGWRWARTGLLAVFLLSNAALFTEVQWVRDPFRAAFGLEERHAYLERKLPAYAAWRFVNAELPRDARLLVIGDPRAYYIDRSHTTPMPHLPTPLRTWTQDVSSAKDLRRALVSKGFSHILFNAQEAARIAHYGILDMTAEGRAVWDALLAGLPRLYQERGVEVYSLHG